MTARRVGSARSLRALGLLTAAACAVMACAVMACAVVQAPPPREDGAAARATGPRVLLVGDSWTGFLWNHRSLRNVFRAQGRPDVFERGGPTTRGGTTAADWASALGRETIETALRAEPSIEVVQLTIGGNDFLAGPAHGGWFAGIDDAERDARFGRIASNVAAVVDHVHGRAPHRWVVVSLYDHLNFVESLSESFAACAAMYASLRQPTPRQINDALVRLEETIADAVATRPRTIVVRHSGTMQDAFGFPDDPDLPSPIAAMFKQEDCIHLSREGYDAIARNLWRDAYAFLYEERVFFDSFETADVARWTPSADAGD
ncbi:MAG: hypothetical protein AAF772_04430 [Acidobacteriota bacterium]